MEGMLSERGQFDFEKASANDFGVLNSAYGLSVEIAKILSKMISNLD